MRDQFGRFVHGEREVEQAEVEREFVEGVRPGAQQAGLRVDGSMTPTVGGIRSAAASAATCTVMRAW